MDCQTLRVAVVGAGGFLGKQVLAAAVNDPRVAPSAVIRGPHSIPAIAGFAVPVHITHGDADQLADALSRVDVVIDTSVGPAVEIVSSAAALARACERANVSRLVFTSSAAAQPVRRRRLGRSRAGSYYGRQKAAAEGLLSDSCGNRDFVAVRPGLIWGPASPWTRSHLRALLRGTPFVPSDSGVQKPHLAYGPNLAQALVDAAVGGERVAGVVDYADSWWRSWMDYADALALSCGVAPGRSGAARLHAGPVGALLVEQVLQRPWLAGRCKVLLDGAPAAVVGAVRLALRPPVPPSVPGSSSRRSDRVRMTYSEIDVFTRWRNPSSGRAWPLNGEKVGRDTALAETASWAVDTGFLSPLSIVEAA